MRRKILCGRISWAKAASLVATTFRGFRDIPWRLAQLRRENLGEPVCLTPLDVLLLRRRLPPNPMRQPL